MTTSRARARLGALVEALVGARRGAMIGAPIAARLGALVEGERRRLFLWTPVLLGLGAQLYFLAPAEPPRPAPWVCLALAAALAGVAGRAGGLRLPALAAAWVTAGFGLADLRADAAAAPVLAAETTAVVEGRVRAVNQSRAGRARLLLDEVFVFGLDADGTPARVRVALRAGDGEGLRPGERVSVLARLDAPRGPVEPGAFDFARAAWFDRLGAVGVARGPVARLGPAEARGLTRALVAVDRARAAIGGWLRAGIPGEAGAFAAAITVGESAGLPPETLEALRDSNLAHLLSISGLHMVVVAGLAFSGVRLALALVPGLALRWPTKPIAAAAALVAATVYLGLSGAETPTQRAFVMAAVAFAAIIADRPGVTVRALALAALVVLALAPESLLDAGFQMSFAATLALVGAYEVVRARGWLGPRRSAAERAARVLAGLVLTSAVAGAATAPFAAYHFNRTTGWGLPANLLAVPAMSLGTAPALTVAAALAPFGLEGPALAVAGATIDWMLGVARFFAALPGAARGVAAVHPAALWATVAAGLWLCLWRGPLRLGAAPVAAAAVWLWLAPPERPALLIAPGGAAVGALAPEGGRVFDAGPGERFAVETWLRRDGDATPVEEALERRRFAAARGWSEAQLADGWRVLVRRPGAPPPPCEARTLVAATGGPRRAGPCVALDMRALRTAVAVRIEPQGLTIIEAGGAARPWTPPTAPRAPAPDPPAAVTAIRR